MLGASAAHEDVAASDRGRHQERAGLDAIGDDREVHAVQPRRAADADDRLAGAAHLRAHGAQGGAEIGDLRLTGGVLDDRLALGERRHHHQVLGGADRGQIEMDARAAKAIERLPRHSRARCR